MIVLDAVNKRDQKIESKRPAWVDKSDANL